MSAAVYGLLAAEPCGLPYGARVSDATGSGTLRLPTLLVDLAAGREPRDTTLTAEVVEIANDHRMTGLLWSWARKQEVAMDLKLRLAQDDLFVQAHLNRVWKVLDECVTRLRTVGIDVATIKGVTAEARWYARRGDRPCSDVDLLLSPHQLDRAGEAVALLEPDHPWREHVGRLARSGRIQGVTTHVDGLEVDFHFDLLKLGIRTRQSVEIWRRTDWNSLPSGGTVPVLDDTTALVHLLVHLNKDRFQRLLQYADIARVIAVGRVDWQRFQRFIDAEGIAISTLRTLETVLEEMHLPWPTDLRRAVGPRAHLWSAVWPKSIRLRGLEGRMRYRKRQAWIAFLAHGRGAEALRWWIEELFPPAPIVSARYVHVPGPYLWKLLRGRLRPKRAR